MGITVGLNENNKACGKITMLQPPGGESHMANLCIPEVKIVKNSQRIIQPPGGASTDIFSSDSSDTGSEAGEEPTKRKYRLASNFVLGDEPPKEMKIKSSKKSAAPVVNPVTGEVMNLQEGESANEVVQPAPQPAKPNRVPPGGHSTPLW